jgi:hypothetical protein
MRDIIMCIVFLSLVFRRRHGLTSGNDEYGWEISRYAHHQRIERKSRAAIIYTLIHIYKKLLWQDFIHIYTWRCKVAIKMHHQIDQKYNTYMSFEIMHVVKLKKRSWRMTNPLQNDKEKLREQRLTLYIITFFRLKNFGFKNN